MKKKNTHIYVHNHDFNFVELSHLNQRVESDNEESKNLTICWFRSDLEQSKLFEIFKAFDYQMNDHSATMLKEFLLEQKKKHKANCLKFNLLNKQHEKIIQRLKTINNAIKLFTCQYISSNELVSSTRKIIRSIYNLNQKR